MPAATNTVSVFPASRKRFNILVIDDDRSYRRYFQKYLEVLGFSVLSAKTGEGGLSLARARKPDLVFLDLCLGFGSRLSGNETLRTLKADAATRDIPVIAMSGIKNDPEDQAQVRRDGAEEFLAKSEINADDQGQSTFLRRVSALLMLKEIDAIPKLREPFKTEFLVVQPEIDSNPPGLTFTVLLIDDEEESVGLIKTLFSKHPAYRVLSADGGAQGLRLAASELPDLIILDLVMPGMCGQEVCKRLREQERTFYLPILILSADMRVKQEINCMNLGADDYLVKPVGPARLMARIRSLIRRYRFRGNSRGVVRRGVVSLDSSAHRLTIGEKTVGLTPLESALLALLMSAEGRVVDKRVLYKKLYNSWPPLRSSVIKAHIRNLREKLGDGSELIANQKEQGYRFDVEYADRLGGAGSGQGRE